MQKEAKMKFTVPKLIFLLATIAIIAIILSGDFDEVGYASKQIFIKKDDLYYVFNIDSYTVPENLYAFAYDNYDDIVLSYEMNEYTAEEFSNKYDSGAIDWGIDDFG